MSQNVSSNSSKDAPYKGRRVAVNLRDVLANSECEFETSADDAEFYEDDADNRPDQVFDLSALQEQVNFDCIGASDPAATPFEELAVKMADIFMEGKVKKRVLQEGTVRIPEDAAVRVHYNCYTEMEEVPFDSSYLRSKYPIRFQLGDGALFVGFEVALKSMTVGEKAQFLIHPDLAFGALGSLSRIPPNATVMLIAEVIRLDLSPEEEPLSVQDRKDFKIVYERAKVMNIEANKCVKDRYMGQAVRIYRRAEDLLTGCSLKNDEEEVKFKKLLLKIYGNMAVCFNSPQMNQPKRTCLAVKKAFETDPTNASKNPKLFYHRGVAHMNLAEYSRAKNDLKRAQRLVPNDEDVQKQIGILEKKMQTYKEFEEGYYAKAFGFTRPATDDVTHLPDVIDDECRDAASRLLEDFANRGTNVLHLASEYTTAERQWLKTESDRLNLKYLETAIGPNKYDVTIMK